MGIFIFPSEDNINHDRCSIAHGDCRSSSHGKPCKALGVTGKMQTAGEEKANSKQDWEDHLGITDLTVVLVGTIRFTRILKRTLEKFELNAEEQRLRDDLQRGKH